MRKIFLSLIISTTTFLPFYTQAEQIPPICNSSPHELTDYFSSITSVLNQLDINSTTNSSCGFGALGEKIAQTGLGTIALFMTFGAEGLVYNFFPSIIVIFHEPYIVRDWVKLINFKKYITQAFLQAASKGILKENIPSQTLEKIKSTMRSNPYFLHEPEFSTYQDFFKYIRDNQQDIESLYLLVVVNLTNKKSLTTNFPINQQHLADITKIFKKYLKPNGDKYQCDLELKKAFDKLKEIIDLSKKAKNSIQRFECNYQRLKNVLFGTPFSGSCGNTKLVEGRHIGVKGQIKIQGAGKIIINAITNSEQKVIDTSNFNPSFKFLGKLWNNIKESFDYKTGEANFAKYSETKFINEIKTITTNIKKQKKEASTTLLHVSPEFTQNLTPQFPTLSEKIWIGICTIDTEYPGCNDLPSNTKNKLPQKGIYQNLVETCKNQSPFIGRCRYLGF